ncbi:MAG: hypothetical protein U1E76_26205, partial [Planctomycetota bacterium]
ATAAALVNYLLVRATMPGREGLGLRIFWGVATAAFTLAALDSRFQVQERVSTKVRAWMLSSHVISYSSAGYEAVDRYFLAGVLVASVLVLACFQRSLARYRALPHFDAHKPLYFALLFLALAALCHTAQANGKLQVYFSHLEDLSRLASVVLFLAAFATVAMQYAGAHLEPLAGADERSDALAHMHAHESLAAAAVTRRKAPVVIQEADQDMEAQDQEVDEESHAS